MIEILCPHCGIKHEIQIGQLMVEQRNQKLSPAKRSNIARKASNARWSKVIPK